MSADYGVALLVGDDNDTAIIEAVDAGPRHLTVVRRCADSAELEAAGMSGVASLAVIAGDDPDLDAHLCERLHSYGMLIVVLRPLSAGDDGPAAGYYVSLGADRVLNEGDTGGILAALESLTLPQQTSPTVDDPTVDDPTVNESVADERATTPDTITSQPAHPQALAADTMSSGAISAHASTTQDTSPADANAAEISSAEANAAEISPAKPSPAGASADGAPSSAAESDADDEFAALMASALGGPSSSLSHAHSSQAVPGVVTSDHSTTQTSGVPSSDGACDAQQSTTWGSGASTPPATADGRDGEAAAASDNGLPSYPPRRRPSSEISGTRGLIHRLFARPSGDQSPPSPTQTPNTPQSPPAAVSLEDAHVSEGMGGQPRPQRRGAVIAVYGTTGAPGRTTTAIHVAAELAESASVGLFDADIVAPSVAHALGLSVDGSSLSALARMRARGALTPAHIDEAAYTGPKNMRIVTGLTSAHRWREAAPTTIHSILDVCRQMWDYTVVDMHAASSDPLDEYHRHTPHRDHVITRILDDADAIIVVARADALGLHRFTEAWEWLDQRNPKGRRIVVANMAQVERTGTNPHQAISQALSTTIPGVDVSVVPFDARVLKALLRGTTLSGSHKRTVRGAYHDVAQRIRAEVGPMPQG